MKIHVGNLIFNVTTIPSLPPESFAIVSETEAAIWQNGTITMVSREEYNRRLQLPGKDTNK
jgi:hypothetical protein